MAQGIPDLKHYTTTGHPQSEAFLYKRLSLSGMTYQVETFAGVAATGAPVGGPTKTKMPDGWWDFVIRCDAPGVVFVRRERHTAGRWKKAKGISPHLPDRGHSSIAESTPVLFAGSIFFGGPEALRVGNLTPHGVMVRWENKSGHYWTGKGFSGQALKQHCLAQTGSVRALLPADKFEPWNEDLLPHNGEPAPACCRARARPSATPSRA